MNRAKLDQLEKRKNISILSQDKIAAAKKLGAFESTPISGNAVEDAQEILARTYKSKRFKLFPIISMRLYDYLDAWIFLVVPNSTIKNLLTKQVDLG